MCNAITVITSWISTHMQNLVTIPEWVHFPHMREIAHQMFTRLLFWVLPTLHSRGPRTDFHAQYVTRRGSAQGCAFLRLENKKITFKPSYSRKNAIFDRVTIPWPNSKGNPFSGGAKYTGVGKIGDFRRI